MPNRNHTKKHLFCISGLAVVCFIVLSFLHGFSNVQPQAKDISFAAAHKPVHAVLSFRNPSTVHRSLTNNKSNGHFSLRNKNTVKLLLKKYSPAILSSAHFYFAKLATGRFIAHYSTSIPAPGYYLFLFRYALF